MFGLLVGTATGWRVLAPVLLSVVEHSESGRRCDDWIGQMAAVVQGELMADRDRCLGDPLDGARTQVLLGRIARDRTRPEAARMAAMRVMVDGRPGLTQEVVELLDTTDESPAFHRRAFRAIVLARGGAAWAEDPARFPGHGMYDVAVIEGAADGLDRGPASSAWMLMGGDREPRDRAAVLDALGTTTVELRRAVAEAGAGYVPRKMPPEWRTILSRSSCEPRCDELIGALLAVDARLARDEPAPSAPSMAGDDALLDLLYAELGDHVRAEMVAVLERSVADPARQGERLLGFIASTYADELPPAEALEEAGDLHAVLRHAVGSAGAVAASAELLGAAAGGARLATLDGALFVEVDGARRVLRPCEVPVEGVAPAEAVTVPPRGGSAMALRDRAGQALRVGLRNDAELFLTEAAARWPEMPGLSTIRAAVFAARFAAIRPRDAGPARPEADPAGRTGWRLGTGRLVSVALRPEDAGEFPVRGSALRMAAEAVRAEASQPEDLVFASWWAFAYGDGELARLLAPSPQSGALEDLRMAVMLGVGEPGRPIGPWSRAILGQDVGAAVCIDASLPWPTMPGPRSSPSH